MNCRSVSEVLSVINVFCYTVFNKQLYTKQILSLSVIVDHLMAEESLL